MWHIKYIIIKSLALLINRVISIMELYNKCGIFTKYIYILTFNRYREIPKGINSGNSWNVKNNKRIDFGIFKKIWGNRIRFELSGLRRE